MAVPAIIPKLGNTVESCVIVEWKKAVGDAIAEGETLLDVETDKAVMEVPSPASGVVLAHFYNAGDLVPVLETIAVIGAAGEDVSAYGSGGTDKDTSRQADGDAAAAGKSADAQPVAEGQQSAAPGVAPISPRARSLAQREGLEVANLAGSGPGGRIIERDVQAALASRPKLSPVAQAKLAEGGFTAPERGSGPGGRVMTRDLKPAEVASRLVDKAEADKEKRETREDPEVEVVKVTSADARGLQTLRARFKTSNPAFGLQGVTINDLILLAVARALPEHPDLNAQFQGDTLSRFKHVQLGLAVDTPAGLMVPVIRNANQLNLRQISREAKRLVAACQARRVTPDELRGGTFTVTNLGGLGIESFTPVLNPPEVAILGIGNINLKAVQRGDASAPSVSMTGTDTSVAFVPHIGLSLTINHQVVDGAPAARFLQALARNLADIDLLLAG